MPARPKRVGDLYNAEVKLTRSSPLQQQAVTSGSLSNAHLSREGGGNIFLVDQRKTTRKGYNYGYHCLWEKMNVAWESLEVELKNIDGWDISKTHVRSAVSGLIDSRRLVFVTVMYGKAARSDTKVAENFVREFHQHIAAEKYITQWYSTVINLVCLGIMYPEKPT